MTAEIPLRRFQRINYPRQVTVTGHNGSGVPIRRRPVTVTLDIYFPENA